MHIARRLLLQHSLSLVAVLLPQPPAPALATGGEPSAEAVNTAKQAFEAFNQRKLPLADSLFTQTIEEWRRLECAIAEGPLDPF